jgi:protein-tyrosine-phosphatase
MFDIRKEDGTPVVAHLLSLTPFRRIVKHYFMICDSYYEAIRTATPDKIAHDPAKWTPVFGSGHAQNKGLTRVDAPLRARNPQAVLFVCGLNSVRSPMAESLLRNMFPGALYVKSAGVRKGELDPFAVAVMAELGQDISGHKPTTFEELDDWEGLNFDLIITLAPEAHHKALELTHTLAADVEYWPTHDPTGAEGNREQKLEAYREVCDTLSMRIRKRFSKAGAASG